MQRAAGPQPMAQMPSCLIVVGTPSLSPFLLPHPLFRSLSLVRAPLVAAILPAEGVANRPLLQASMRRRNEDPVSTPMVHTTLWNRLRLLPTHGAACVCSGGSQRRTTGGPACTGDAPIARSSNCRRLSPGRYVYNATMMPFVAWHYL
jgi:hypothetical protein